MRTLAPDELLTDRPRPGVARLTINRPARRNAQDTALIVGIDAALVAAGQDPDVKVIVVAAAGPHFSGGHDLKEPDIYAATEARTVRAAWVDDTGQGIEPQMAREKDLYLETCERWRNLPKPTIAQVQGLCVAGGLMLAWPCDLIVAAEDAVFVDNTVGLGVNGHEFFVHHLEVGVRKAKEMLFTGDGVDAHEALRRGMVNHVVPNAGLEAFTLDLAGRIAQRPTFALKLAKLALNAAQDAAGRRETLTTSFALHQLAHSHNMLTHDCLVDPSGLGPTLSQIDVEQIRGRRGHPSPWATDEA
ncbi:MAG TPA: enoyl-CoA hydratase [Phenylobacterium sp.]